MTTTTEIAAGLGGFTGRRGGSDAERRAAVWLSERVRDQGRTATIEPFWCRPNWALAHAWHALLGLGASVLLVSDPRIGGALALVTIVSVACDAATGHSLGRRLTPERASQNVVALDPRAPPGGARLIVTANYDAGRTGLVYRPGPRASAAALRRAATADGRLTPGWLGWLTIALLWLVVVAVARNGGSMGTPIDALQLVPSVALLGAAIVLLELCLSATSPGAADNASGVAVALATIAALDAREDGSTAIDLVLQGASEGDPARLRQHLHRTGRLRTRPIVLGIAASGSGSPQWWRSDGPLWPLGYDRQLRELAADACQATDGRRGRGATPAFSARAAGLRAIAIGCLDDRGLVPRSHLRTDTPDGLDPSSLDATTRAAVAIVTATERTGVR